MTLIEKALLLSGKDTFHTTDFKKYGIPSLCLSDGPHGLRKQLGASDHLGLNESIKATCFPTAATIANSWDDALAERVGECLGEEAKSLGVHVILGPGLNIKRNPLCGRNFEYFSEDPYLSGKLAAAFIRGIQSKGVAACPKHYAVNSQELRRMSNDSVIDERTLREIYLYNFELAIKEGKAKFLMTSYNRVNGDYTNEHEHLLTNILYDEWQYEGVVVTDWGGSNSHVEGVRLGSHLEMPSTGLPGALELVEAVNNGVLSEEILDQRVDELLTIIFELSEDNSQREASILPNQVDRHHELAKEAARESIVLLKNDHQILPLKPKVKIAVVGDFAKTPRYQGAGSSAVNPTQLDSILSVMNHYDLEMTSFSKGYERGGKVNPSLVEEALKNVEAADVVLIFAGLDEISETEGAERGHMKMPRCQEALINEISAKHARVVVVLSSGSPVEMPWKDHVQGIVHGYLLGQAGAGAMMDALVGNHCPSGKLNESYPVNYGDTPSVNYYPGLEKTSEYREGIYVGYRYYETANIPVNFPFGYGLSYTTFEYSDLEVKDNNLTFKIKNTGNYDGAEIAQVYLSAPGKEVFRAKKELIAYEKVWLSKGEEKQITLTLSEKAFKYFNTKTNDWEIESGSHTILVGASVADIRLRVSKELLGTTSITPYDKEKMQCYFSADIKEVQDQAYQELLGFEIPNSKWDSSKPLELNDTISQMYYAKSWLARFVYKILTYLKNRSEKKGKPDLNILYIYNMPFRAIAKMMGGAVSMEMVESVLIMVNGHFFRGISRLNKAFWANRKVLKREKEYAE